MALEQHRQSKEMLENRPWLISILSAIRDGVIATDALGRVQLLNFAAEKMTGWKLQDAIGQPIETVYPVFDLQGHSLGQSLKKTLSNGGSESRTRLLLSSKHGLRIPIEVSSATVYDAQGAISGAVSVFFDITERLRLEQLQTDEHQRLEQQMASTSAALIAARAELHTLAGRLLTAQEEERRRLARELHDDASQRLALLDMQAQHLAQLPASDEMRSGLVRLRGQADLLSCTLRDLSHRLHPSELEHLGLTAALRSLVNQYQAQGLDVSFSLRNVTGLVPLEAATALYRITQEALHNILKHAPGTSAQVTVEQDADQLHLLVQDNGSGFDLEQGKRAGGLGLLSMQERARAIGATFTVEPQPGSGTAVRAHVPLASSAAK